MLTEAREVPIVDVHCDEIMARLWRCTLQADVARAALVSPAEYRISSKCISCIVFSVAFVFICLLDGLKSHSAVHSVVRSGQIACSFQLMGIRWTFTTACCYVYIVFPSIVRLFTVRLPIHRAASVQRPLIVATPVVFHALCPHFYC